jgi:hypothetical protein
LNSSASTRPDPADPPNTTTATPTPNHVRNAQLAELDAAKVEGGALTFALLEVLPGIPRVLAEDIRRSACWNRVLRRGFGMALGAGVTLGLVVERFDGWSPQLGGRPVVLFVVGGIVGLGTQVILGTPLQLATRLVIGTVITLGMIGAGLVTEIAGALVSGVIGGLVTGLSVGLGAITEIWLCKEPKQGAQSSWWGPWSSSSDLP